MLLIHHNNMSESENLLIDLNNSASNENESTAVYVKQECMATDTISLMQTTVPIYKLLNNDDVGTTEYSDNNPFDRMDKQAVLYNDPFEIVSNAALVNSPNKSNAHSNVETGMLISIDSPTERNTFFSADTSGSDITMTASRLGGTSDLFNVSPISDGTSNSSQPGEISPIDNKSGNNSVPSFKNSPTRASTPPNSEELPSGGARSSGRSKSNSLKLLKYSLSNKRGDADRESSPTFPSSDGSPKLQSSPFKARSWSKSRFNDDSFDDLAETKPNWIDSLTDIDFCSDIDSDLENMNFPMLNKSLSELDLKATDGTDNSADTVKKKSPTATSISNRDQLLKKLESIKHKTPSPSADMEQPVDKPGATLIVPVGDEEPRTPLNQFSIVPDSVKTDAILAYQLQHKSDNANSLIQNLKKFVEQCDDKDKQAEANSLLQSLSSILSTGEKKQKYERKNMDATIPKPIVRQGTFSIEKSDSDESEQQQQQPFDHSASSIEDTAPAVAIKSDETSCAAAGVSDEMNPGLSHVLKELQQMWGSAPVNVLQTSIQSGEGQGANANTNPTYIVVMGTPSTNDLASMQNSPNPLGRNWRSQSLSAKDRPAAALRAAQLKAQAQAQLHTSISEKPGSHATTTPLRTSFNRRSSFSAATSKDKPGSAPNYTPIRRRSIQLGTSSMTPLSKSRISLAGGSTSSPTAARRRSVMSSPAREPPQKLKTLKPSSGTIMKPPAPPAARNFRIRVKESLSGRSAAPLKAMVPMNRVASLVNINESVVAAIPKNPRRSLVTSTPKFPITKLMQPTTPGGKH